MPVVSIKITAGKYIDKAKMLVYISVSVDIPLYYAKVILTFVLQFTIQKEKP